MNILDKLKMVKDDPMWADHSEITKKTLGQAIDEIERLRAQAKRHEAEKAELRATRARYAASLDAIYAAWHGAGVDLAGGNWQRFVGMLPPLYTAPPAQAVSVPEDIEEYLSAYEWRAEDGGLSELTTRDRQLLQDFANGLPLYTALPAQAESLTTPTLNASCVPDVLFDGYSVMQELTPQAKRTTSAEQVSWVLDAVVRLIRKQKS